MVKVSVIIPTRNRATIVHQAIESILAQQTEQIEFEVIVIDDGSTAAIEHLGVAIEDEVKL